MNEIHNAVQQLYYWIKCYEEVRKVELFPREFETCYPALVKLIQFTVG